MAKAAPGGWSFPPAFDRLNKTVCISAGTTNITENLRILFSTDLGERFLLPAYGTPLTKYLFGPLTTTTENELRRDLQAAIALWEPRIELLSVDLLRQIDSPQTIEIHITYRELLTGAEVAWSAPFSLETPESVIEITET